MAEPGWYHCEGDVPGSVRRWNGEQWIGFPTRLHEDHAEAQSEQQSLAGFLPLSSAGRIAALASVGGFALLGILLLNYIWQSWRGRGDAPSNAVVPSFIEGSGTTFLILTIVAVLTTIAFLGWLMAAARSSGALTSRQLRFATDGAPFVAALYLVLAPTAFLLDSLNNQRGKTKERTRRPGILATVNLVAEHASKRGGRPVNPIKILAWWILMLVPVLGALGLMAWYAWQTLSDPATPAVSRTTRQVIEVLFAAEIISLACITATVIAITLRLLTR